MADTTSVQKKDDIDFGAIIASTATSVVKNNPIKVSTWVFGLILAAFATGFAVDETTRASYELTIQQAGEVHSKELYKAQQNLKQAEGRHYELKGWFWACDNKCQKALDKVNMAKAEVGRFQKLRDDIITEARREVGIWSTIGVQDIRNGFWSAWKSGKDWAARMTMMDAMFMAFGGKEETAVSMILKVIAQYIINLTMGLVGSFFFFMYNVYNLIVSYGEPMMSGLAFFLLVLVAGMATIGTYLFAIMGTVAGGGIFLAKKAKEQAKLEQERGGGQARRQVQYGGGRPGAGRRVKTPPLLRRFDRHL
jgi:hypothetical protein